MLSFSQSVKKEVPDYIQMPQRWLPNTDKIEYRDNLVNSIHKSLVDDNPDLATAIINDDDYFAHIHERGRKIIDLDLYYKNSFHEYSEEYLNETVELQIYASLHEASKKIISTDVASKKAAFAQAIIRWFHICFGDSKGLFYLLGYDNYRNNGGKVTFNEYMQADRIKPGMYTIPDYVLYILQNKRVNEYMKLIIDLDPSLTNCRTFDNWLERHHPARPELGISGTERVKYLEELFDAAQYCFRQGLLNNKSSRPRPMPY